MIISSINRETPPSGAGGSVSKRAIPQIAERIHLPVGVKRILQRGKKIYFFFVVVFLFASLAIAFHHHDDGHQHDECSLCIASNLLSSGNLEINESFVFQPTATYLYQPEESFHHALSKFTIYADRAPPVSLPS